MTPLFLGLSGLTLTDDERALFTDAQPAGYILFKRNVEDPAQVRALTDELRVLSGRDDVPILIDQEGGRVARLRPPHWPEFPTGAAFGRLFEAAPLSGLEAARLNALALAVMLKELGINVDCLPVLDVPVPGAHDVIGDRAYGLEPMRVASLGDATLKGLRAGGCVGVVKHIPGHGRAGVDSHLELPVVTASREDLATDFEPFRKLRDAPMAMTAHVVYTALDADRCATLSPTVIDEVIRGEIGFDGLLMSDDLGMKALSAGRPSHDFGAFAAESLAAGCDIALHCSGDIGEMRAIAGAVGEIGTAARDRLERAMAWPSAGGGDLADLVAKRDALLAVV